jgi:hypothetical protein
MNLLCVLALVDRSVTIESLRITHFAGLLAVWLVLGCASVSILRRSLRWVPLYSALFLLHPTWTMSITPADSGLYARFVSIATSLVLAAILLCQIFWPDLSRRRFLISLCVISWVAYFSSIYLSEYWNGFLERGFVRQAIASLMLAQTRLMEIAPALTLICFLQWLWYWLRPGKVMDSARAKVGDNSQVGLRLFCAALACFFLVFVALFGCYHLITKGRLFGPEPVIALLLGIVSTVAAIRGRIPGWEIRRGR